MKEWVVKRYHQSVMSEFNEEQIWEGLYRLLGHDPQTKPAYENLQASGSMPPEYVANETRRAVAGAQGQAKVYAGIGIDVPTYAPHLVPFPSTEEAVYTSTRAALDAGADGVVASREYQEMQLTNLRAYGRAVAEGRP